MEKNAAGFYRIIGQKMEPTLKTCSLAVYFVNLAAGRKF